MSTALVETPRDQSAVPRPGSDAKALAKYVE